MAKLSGTFLEISTEKFQKLPNEDAELVNEGMYGKAISLYLQDNLNKIGYSSPYICCEDWGWWVSIKGVFLDFGLCVYCREDESGKIAQYVICSSISDDKKWKWSKFKYIPTAEIVEKLMADLSGILSRDSEIINIKRHDEFPF